MPDEKKKPFLHSRFHCNCDLPDWVFGFALKTTMYAVLPITLLLYLGYWYLGGSFESPDAMLFGGMFLSLQRVVSGSRILDPFALALGGGLLIYTVGLSLATALWEIEQVKSWCDRVALGQLLIALASLCYFGGFCVATVLYGAIFSFCVFFPIVGFPLQQSHWLRIKVTL
jgi:hypothetical protein